MIFRINLLSPSLLLPLIFVLPAASVFAQRQKKTDKLILSNLDTHIRYLSDGDGHNMGGPAEKLASDYIASEFSKTGLKPRGDNGGWLQAFQIDQGRIVSGDAYFVVNDHALVLNKEYFPLSFSAIGTVSGSPAIALQESGVPWFLDLRDLLESADGGNMKADPGGAIREKAAAFARKGATALIVYNSSKTPDNLAFDPRDKSATATIPIIYITAAAKRKYFRDESASVDIRIKTGFSEKTHGGHNVVGYLDNGAASTVVIGARYDRGDSLDKNNAPGVAALIELSRILASSKLKNNNYLFVAFSGTGQGSFGSRFLADHLPVDPRRLNYLLDLDRIAAPQDSSYGLIVGGYGSSPSWWGACREVDDKMSFRVQLDSGYSRPGDATFFYAKDIPTLVFYTGADNPGHGFELDVVKYVFDLVKAANTRGKLAFTSISKN